MESDDNIKEDIDKVVDSFEKVQYNKFQYTSRHNNRNFTTNPNPSLRTNPKPKPKPNRNLRKNPNPNPNPNPNSLKQFPT